MEIHITSRTLPDETGRLRTFHYYLTVGIVETGSFCFENYGVRICEEQAHSVCIPSLTTSAVRFDQLMTTLVDNAVAPSGLRDVVEEWL